MITINAIGLDEMVKKFDELPEKLQIEVSATVEAAAKTFVENAHRDAPVRKTKVSGTKGTFGSNLKQMITYYQENKLSFVVVSGSRYSPYLEWGTITHVSVPAELSDYAIQFKGRGIHKKGGINPQPFFFKQMIPVREQLVAGIKAIKL